MGIWSEVIPGYGSHVTWTLRVAVLSAGGWGCLWLSDTALLFSDALSFIFRLSFLHPVFWALCGSQQWQLWYQSPQHQAAGTLGSDCCETSREPALHHCLSYAAGVLCLVTSLADPSLLTWLPSSTSDLLAAADLSGGPLAAVHAIPAPALLPLLQRSGTAHPPGSCLRVCNGEQGCGTLQRGCGCMTLLLDHLGGHSTALPGGQDWCASPSRTGFLRLRWC